MDATIRTADGHDLHATLHDGNSDRALLVASAMGVKRRYYDAFARFMAGRGITTITFDYRGIGDSRPRSLRGHGATMRQWGEQDIPAAIDWIAREVRPRTLYYAGHSCGGQLAGAAPNIDHVSKLVMVCAQSGYWRHWPGLGALGLGSLWIAMPLIASIVGYFPSAALGLGSDPLPRGVATQWAKWGRHPEYLFSELDSAPYARVDAPMLAWSFAADRYAPKAAVDALLRHYSGAAMTRRHVEHPSIGHFDFFRRTKGQELWEETLAWLNAPDPDTPR